MLNRKLVVVAVTLLYYILLQLPFSNFLWFVFFPAKMHLSLQLLFIFFPLCKNYEVTLTLSELCVFPEQCFILMSTFHFVFLQIPDCSDILKIWYACFQNLSEVIPSWSPVATLQPEHMVKILSIGLNFSSKEEYTATHSKFLVNNLIFASF